MNNLTPSSDLTRKDFVSSNDVRWCPGCGDYAIINALQSTLPNLGIPREKFVFVSGIGCSSRFPYYMNTYGFHTIHGRAPTFATGIKVANPDLSVWVITGDGDGLSIGGNHLVHTLRRNIDINIILFNNKIYGLTKGQYSPTSVQGQVTKTSPFGSLEQPINPICVALASEATFVARTVDTNPAHMKKIFEAAANHKGVSFVEVFQKCVIFNNKAWDDLSGRDVRDERFLFLEDGEPLRFGKEKEKGIIMNGANPVVVTPGEHGIKERDLKVHEAGEPNPSYAYTLAQMAYPELPTPIGIFRSVEKPTYEKQITDQVQHATTLTGRRNLQTLLRGSNYWHISDDGDTITQAGQMESRFQEEDRIMDERLKAMLRNNKSPLITTLRTKVGSVYREYGYKRTKIISSTDSVAAAISVLKSYNVKSLLVMDGDNLAGFITQWDILMYVLLSPIDRDHTRVSTLLKPSYDFLDEDDTVADAINRLAVSGDKLIPIKLKEGEDKFGLFTTRQILWFLYESLEKTGEEKSEEKEPAGMV